MKFTKFLANLFSLSYQSDLFFIRNLSYFQPFIAELTIFIEFLLFDKQIISFCTFVLSAGCCVNIILENGIYLSPLNEIAVL